MTPARPDAPLLGVVLPVHDEDEAIEDLLRRLDAALDPPGVRRRYVFVDDGSTDGSADRLDRLALERRDLRVVHLSRNFGHQAAVLAGLEHAPGDAVVVMDTDLQDAPDALPAFLEKWREGYDVVYAVRFGRKESLPKRALFFLFYRLLNAVSQTAMPLDAGNFCLVDARVARSIAALPERDRYFAGLRRWVGFRQVGVPVERAGRYDDAPRVSTIGLVRLAKAAVFSFSSLPLTVFYLVAGLSLTVAVGLAAFTLYHRLVTGLAIPGWTSALITPTFFGGLNSLGIAILGEFVIRIYDQVRARPPYLVDRVVGGEADREG